MGTQKKDKTERKTEKVREAGIAQFCTNLGNPERPVRMDISAKLAFTGKRTDILLIS